MGLDKKRHLNRAPRLAWAETRDLIPLPSAPFIHSAPPRQRTKDTYTRALLWWWKWSPGPSTFSGE